VQRDAGRCLRAGTAHRRRSPWLPGHQAGVSLV